MKEDSDAEPRFDSSVDRHLVGLEFSLGFPATVLLAHAAFGAVLGVLAYRFSGAQPSVVFDSLRSIFAASPASPAALEGR